jgi:hypothetical protein
MPKIWRICPKCLDAMLATQKDVCAGCGGPLQDCPLEAKSQKPRVRSRARR